MTITTPSPISLRSRRLRGGFTLMEVMIGATLSSFILAGVLSTFLFLGRSGASMRNYSDMETQARRGLELFAADTRQASSVAWNSETSLTLVVNMATVTYTYNAGSATFTRTTSGGTTTLLTGVTAFNFLAYTITGSPITNVSTAAARTAANIATKQIQISLSASRATPTVTRATNIMLSARYVLRNKRVTA
jgi:Tfp pilus assembly protein PilV